MSRNRTQRSKRYLLGVSALLALGFASSCGNQTDAVDDLVMEEMTEQGIPGAAIVVLKAGMILKVGIYGFANSESGTPVSPETVFRIQSMSKQFTATGVMMLVEEGKVGLDDSVSRYLDESPESWQKLTVRHLLGHTSGLRDFINDSTGVDLWKEATDRELMASVASQPLIFEPGDQWDYSSTNYLLLGMIIERVTGLWYGDFLAERIFQPLGMTHTMVSRDRETAPKGYTRADGEVRPSRADLELAMSVLSAASGGIQSTILDLAKWDAALYTEQLLRRSTLDQMWTPVTLNDGNTHVSGFGWDLGEIANHRRISHSGIWTGFGAHIDRFVDDELTVIVLTNLDQAPTRVSRAIAGTIIPDLSVPVYSPISDREPDVTARFADLLRRTADGGLRAEEFTAPVWDYISSHMDQMQRDFSSFGPVQDLTLVERTETDDGRSYRYLVRFSRTTLRFNFVLTNEDQIAVMMPEVND